MPSHTHRLADPITSEDHAQGEPDATVTLVQYGDYECRYTRLSRHAVLQLQREYPNSNAGVGFTALPESEGRIFPLLRGSILTGSLVTVVVAVTGAAACGAGGCTQHRSGNFFGRVMGAGGGVVSDTVTSTVKLPVLFGVNVKSGLLLPEA